MVASTRWRFAVLSVLSLALVAASCEKPQIVGVTIDSGDITLVVGASHTLTAYADARGGASPALEWLSLSPGIASVTSGGVVLGVTPGTSEIVARSVFDPSKHDSIVATVLPGAATRTLTVARAGLGGGTVTSDPAGIDCGETCTASFDDGTVVTLTAHPAAESTFAGWSGACTGASACVVTMDEPRSVTATFDPIPPGSWGLTVTRAGSGSGTVTSDPPGIDCGATCSAPFLDGTSVTLTAGAASGSSFVGWTGACAGTAATCTVDMTEARAVVATFDAQPHTLSVSKTGTGGGTVTSAPPGIDCGATCSAPFAHGTDVTLTAGAAPGSTFAGWSGTCAGTSPTCVVAMTQPRSVTAAFDLAGPVNDDFADRIALASGSGSTTGSNVGATKEPGEPDHAGAAGGQSVWWSWTAPSWGWVRFDTVGSGFDTVLAVYTGSSVGSLTVVASNDDYPYPTSRVTFYASAGTAYAVAVDGFVSGAGGDVVLRWGAPLPPLNDDFDDRWPLSGASGSRTGTSVAATEEPGEPDHAGLPVENSVWWSWTAPATGWVRFDTVGSSFDTVLAVYTGSSLASLTEVASNDDDPYPTSRVTFWANVGDVLQIAVDGIVSYGDVVLRWGEPLPPRNDDFVDGVSLGGGYGTTFSSGTNVAATLEAGEPHEVWAVGGRSVWWTWIAPQTGWVNFDTNGSSFDTLLGAFTGATVDALSFIAWNDDVPGLTPRSAMLFPAVAGIPYRIVVDGFGGDEGTIGLNHGGLPGTPPTDAPVNDHFSFATVLQGASGATSGANVNATKQEFEPYHAGNVGGRSVWWTWTPATGGSVTISTAGSDFDTLLAVYTGASVTSLTPIASNDDDGASYQSRVTFTAVAGTTYRIAVDGYRYGPGDVANGIIGLSWTR